MRLEPCSRRRKWDRMGASHFSIAIAKWSVSGPLINCWHWREKPSTDKNLDRSKLIGDRGDSLIRCVGFGHMHRSNVEWFDKTLLFNQIQISTHAGGHAILRSCLELQKTSLAEVIGKKG